MRVSKDIRLDVTLRGAQVNGEVYTVFRGDRAQSDRLWLTRHSSSSTAMAAARLRQPILRASTLPLSTLRWFRARWLKTRCSWSSCRTSETVTETEKSREVSGMTTTRPFRQVLTTTTTSSSSWEQLGNSEQDD